MSQRQKYKISSFLITTKFLILFFIFFPDFNQCDNALNLSLIDPPATNHQVQTDVLSWKDLSGAPFFIKHEKFIIDRDTGKAIVVDGSVKFQIVVKISSILNKAPNIIYMCHVNTLRNGHEIGSPKFCRNDNCISLLDIQNNRFEIDQIRFHVSFDSRIGANISSDWSEVFGKPDRPNFSGLYWCEFGNSNGNLESAAMEIQDIMFSYLRITHHSSQELELIPRDLITPHVLPLTLNCPGAVLEPSDAESDFNVEPLLDWVFCNVVGDISAVKCYSYLTKDNQITTLNTVFEKHVIDSRGNLHIFKINPVQPFDQFALVCYSPRSVLNQFGLVAGLGSQKMSLKPLHIDGTAIYKGAPEAVGPLEQTLNIRLGRRNVNYLLLARYRADYDNVRAAWTKDDMALSHKGTDDKFQYDLGTNIQRKQAGTYKLTIGWRDNNAFLVFTFIVNIDFPPIVNLRVPTNFAMERSNLSLLFEITNIDQPLKVSINGHRLSTESSEREMIQQWNKEKDRLSLGGLDFALNPTPAVSAISTSTSMVAQSQTYTVTNLRASHTHTLTVEARNQFGISRLNHIIKVIPALRFKTLPSQTNCSESACLNTDTHEFRCQLETGIRQQILETGAKLQTSWFLEDMQITSMARDYNKNVYFFEIVEEEVLRLNPVVGSQEWVPSVLRHLTDASIKCVVLISDPAVNSQKNLKDEPIFDSRRDPLPDGLDLRLRLLLTVVQDQASLARYSWIWALVVAIICLLVLLIVICVCLCSRRPESATYMLEEQELAQGNDPMKEVLDKEAFKLYERDEEADFENAGSRATLNENSVGFHSDSEPEVEVYDTEPDKFTEEGSLMQQYAGKRSQPGRPNGVGNRI